MATRPVAAQAPGHVCAHVQTVVRLEVTVASRSRLTITVTKSTSQSTVAISSNGKYASLVTNSIGYRETGQPLFSTASEQAFWAAVLPIVQAAIAAGH